ncbi:MAG: CotH kinase family protein, partial [Melioribacteraceae bacterium]|nr:CotH kinase family protein [Melioribacteraceae bacterium]
MRISIKTLYILLLVFAYQIVYSQEEVKPKLDFSHPHGFYQDSFVLTVKSNIPGSIIYYTIDGSNPITSDAVISQNSPLSIEINPSNTSNRDFAPGYVVRAYIESGGEPVSKVQTQTYLFINKVIELSRNNVLPGPGWLQYGAGHDISYGLDPNVYNNAAYSNQIEDAFLSIPSISLVTNLESLFSPDSGIYVNALYHGKDWERSASVELLNPDGSEGFQIDCGLRIRGGWSRHYDNPKHAFRFIFREEYGNKKLNFPLFGDEGVDKFDNIDLRTAQNYSWSYNGDNRNTFIREVFSRDTQRDMNQPYTRSRYYHLYINGTYWGLYQTQERSEASYAESYFGGNAEDYDVIKVDVGDNFDVYNIEATDGSLDKWKLLWDYSQIGFSDNIYYKVQGLNTDGTQNLNFEKLLDVDNLIDYMIITFFVGDFDGPISGFSGNIKPNNFYAIYNRVNPDGFKFFRHDGEHTLFSGGWGEDRTGPFPAGERFLDSNPQWIHQKLSENKNYRLRFADRVYKHFFNNGALTLENNRSRLNERKAEIETAIIAESARWGDSKGQLKTKVHWNDEINNILYNYLPSRAVTVLSQLKLKELFLPDNPPQFNIISGIVEKGFGVELNSTSGEIYYTTNGTDPLVPNGNGNGNYVRTIIDESAIKKVLVPTANQTDSWYKDQNFDDAGWLICNGSAGGIGYDDKQIYTQYISLDVKNFMHESGTNPNTSCFIRIPFNINDQDYSTANKIYLDIRYDDGFVAYLNGEKVLEVNAPNILSWNSSSTLYLDNQELERFDITNYLSSLKNGDNLLAIHGLNTSTQSSDFLILPILTIARESGNGSISPYAVKY